MHCDKLKKIQDGGQGAINVDYKLIKLIKNIFHSIPQIINKLQLKILFHNMFVYYVVFI